MVPCHWTEASAGPVEAAVEMDDCRTVHFIRMLFQGGVEIRYILCKMLTTWACTIWNVWYTEQYGFIPIKKNIWTSQLEYHMKLDGHIFREAEHFMETASITWEKGQVIRLHIWIQIESISWYTISRGSRFTKKINSFDVVIASSGRSQFMWLFLWGVGPCTATNIVDAHFLLSLDLAALTSWFFKWFDVS